MGPSDGIGLRLPRILPAGSKRWSTSGSAGPGTGAVGTPVMMFVIAGVDIGPLTVGAGDDSRVFSGVVIRGPGADKFGIPAFAAFVITMASPTPARSTPLA